VPELLLSSQSTSSSQMPKLSNRWYHFESSRNGKGQKDVSFKMWFFNVKQLILRNHHPINFLSSSYDREIAQEKLLFLFTIKKCVGNLNIPRETSAVPILSIPTSQASTDTLSFPFPIWLIYFIKVYILT